jgi:hypothetical protein
MNWQQLLTSPPPNTGWLLDSDLGAVIHRDAKGEFHCAAEALDPATFEIGPVGLQAVDEEALKAVLARLKGAAEGARTAAVIVPTGWLRSYLIAADRLPRKQDELLDVVRWRLKKLLPIPPTKFRISVVRLPEADGQRHVLCMVGIERAVAAIESSFQEVGVEPGLITTRLFAVVPREAPVDRPSLIIQHEEAFLSLLLLADGVPRLLRTKPLPIADDGAGTVLRETGLTLGFIRDSLGVDGDIEVSLTVTDSDLDAEMRHWLAQREGLVPAQDLSTPPCAPTTVVDRLGAARLAPAMAVVLGEVR